jgi:hypothetical protein
VIVLIQPSGSRIWPLVSRAAAAVSVIRLRFHVPTPVEGDLIREVPVDLQVSRLLVIVVVARPSLIESLVPSQVGAEAVALLEGHIRGRVEDP